MRTTSNTHLQCIKDVATSYLCYETDRVEDITTRQYVILLLPRVLRPSYLAPLPFYEPTVLTAHLFSTQNRFALESWSNLLFQNPLFLTFLWVTSFPKPANASTKIYDFHTYTMIHSVDTAFCFLQETPSNSNLKIFETSIFYLFAFDPRQDWISPPHFLFLLSQLNWA